MGNKLKGLTTKDRINWDKANPQYKSYSDLDRDFLYYKDILKIRGFDQREDYADFKDKVNNSATPEERNQLMVDYFNNAMSEGTRLRIETVANEILAAKNPDVREEEMRLAQEEQANTSVIKDSSKKINIWDAIVSGFKSGLTDYNPYPTQASEDLFKRRNQAKLNVGEEKEEQWESEDEAAKQQDEQFTSLDREITDNDTLKVESIKGRASEFSSVYKNSKLREKYLDLDDYPTEAGQDSWEGIANEYQGVLNKYIGEGKTQYEAQVLADKYLNRRLQNIVHAKQPFWTQMGNGTLQMLETIASTGISFAAMGVGLYDALTGKWDYKQGETWLEYLLDAVNNNSVAVAANNLAEYGTINKESVEQLIEEGGLRKYPVIASWESDNGGVTGMFDKSLVPNLIGQQGFTIALALTSAGLSSGNEAILAASKASKLAKLDRAIMTAEEYSKAAAQISKNIDRVGKVGSAVIATVSGLPEGHQQGYQTKKRILEEGKAYLDDIKQKDLINAFNESLVATNTAVESDAEYMELLDRFSNAYGKQIEADNAGKYDDISNQIELSAIRGATINTLFTNFVNGSINSTLSLSLQAPAVRNRLRQTKLGKAFSQEGFVARAGEDGVTVIPKAQSNIIRQAWSNPVVKTVLGRPAGEFLEEYLQTVGDEFSASAAKNHIANYVIDTYDFRDTAFEDFDGGVSDLSAAWQGIWRGAASAEAFKAGIYGALGSMLGAPTFSRHNYKNPVTGKYDLSKRANESLMDYIHRVTPWNGIFSEYSLNKKMASQATADAKEIEEFFNKLENQEITNDILSIINFERNISEAINEEDEFRARNNILSKLVKQLSMLSRVEGSPVAEAWNNRIAALASMEEGTDIAIEAINKYKQENSTDNLSDKEVFDRVKSNAAKMQEVSEKVSKYLNDAEYIFPNALQQTKEAYAYAMIALGDQQQRAETIRSELQKAQIDTKGSTQSDLTDVEKSAIIQFGSKKKALRGIRALQEEKKKLSQEISKLTNTSDHKVQQLKDSKERKLKSIESQLETYKDLDIKAFEEKKNTVLTLADIAALSEEQRAEMFKADRAGRYENYQKQILDDYIAQGTIVDSNFRQKTIDLARLNTSVKELTDNVYDVVQDATKMDRFVMEQAFGRALGFYTMEGQALSQIQDYDTFVSEATRAFNTSDAARRAVLSSTLDKSNSENWQRFKATREYAGDLLNYAIKNTRSVETFGVRMDKQNLATFGAAVKYLVDEGVDLRDSAKVEEALNQRDADGISLLQKYINETNRGLPRNKQVLFTSIDAIYKDYLHYTHNYDKYKADKDIALAKPKPIENPKPATPVENTKPQTTSQESKPEDKQAKQFTLPETQKAIQEISQKILDFKGKDKDISEFRDFIDSLPDNINFDALYKRFLDRFPAKKGNKIIRKAVDDYKKSIRVETPKVETPQQQPKEEIKDNSTKSPWIKVFGLDAFEAAKYEAVRAVYNKYHIADYLSSGKITPTTEVYFAIEPDLAKGEYYNGLTRTLVPSNAPIMALVKDDNGPVSIEGDKYQPIGIVPTSTDATNMGSETTSIIRSYITADNIRPDAYTLLASSKGVLKTTVRVINDGAYQNGEIQPFRDLLSRDTGETDEEELTKDFVNHIRVTSFTTKEGKEQKVLEYAPSGAVKGATIISSSPISTTNSNGNTLVEVLDSGSVERIVNFNYFTQRLASGLKYLSSSEKSDFLKNLQDDKLSDAAKNLRHMISNSLYITDDALDFKILKNEDKFNVVLMYNNKPVSTVVSDISIGEAFENGDIANIIKQMLTTAPEGIVWQIDYGKVDDKKYMGEVFKSGVLQTKVTSIYPVGTSIVINGSTLNKDFGTEREPRDSRRKTEVANPENASTNPPAEGPVNPTPQVSSVKVASDKIKTFMEASSKLKRNADGTYYTDDNGRSSVRVTSIIREKQEGVNISIAAQTIGNMVDRFTKTFMETGTYNPEDFKSLMLTGKRTGPVIKAAFQDIYNTLRGYNGDSWTFLSPGVDGEFKVTGNVRIVLEDGSLREVPTSGAMDICMINAAQNKMLIIDTKTHNSSEMSEESKEHYRKQLSLYAGFIEQNFGISTEIVILDVPVSYNKSQNYTADINGNLLLGENIEQVNLGRPSLIPLIKIPLDDLRFNLEDLPEDIRNNVVEVLNSVGSDISTDNMPKASTPEVKQQGPENPLSKLFDGIETKPATPQDPINPIISDNPEVHDFLNDFFDGSVEVDGITWEKLSKGQSKKAKEEAQEFLRCASTIEECKNAIRCGNVF